MKYCLGSVGDDVSGGGEAHRNQLIFISLPWPHGFEHPYRR
jgi:hypothetical protein